MQRHGFPIRPVTISAVGVTSVDRMIEVDNYPPEGHFSFVRRMETMPGGTTGNSAVAAARLGAKVHLVTRLGSDDEARLVRERLIAEGIEMAGVRHSPSAPTDESIVIVSTTTGDRTILWKQGARPARGETIDIEGLFGADVCLIDTDDMALFRFLADLPVHTLPNAKLVGTLSYLSASHATAFSDILPRLDGFVGSRRDAGRIWGETKLPALVRAIQRTMWGSNLRCAAITDGARGAYGLLPDEVLHVQKVPVEVVDTTGAGDAFAGAFAFALAQRWALADNLAFCSVVGALTTTAFGAQTGMPSLDQVLATLDVRIPGVGPLSEIG
jgi:ribokinase